MSSTQPRRPDPRTVRTRKAIEGAASKLFADGGLELTTVDEIAEHAGVSVGSLYFHYGSKEGVLLALVARVLETADDYLQAARASSSPVERLLGAGDVYFRFAIEQSVAFRYVSERLGQPREERGGDELVAEPARTAAESASGDAVDASASGGTVVASASGADAGEADAADAPEAPSAKVDAWVRAFIRTIGTDLQQAIDAGEIDDVPVDEAFAFLWGSWTGVANLVLREDALAISPELGERALALGRRVLIRGLGGTVPPSIAPAA